MAPSQAPQTQPSAAPADALSILNIRNIFTIAVVVLAFYLMWLIRGVFTIFVAAMVIAFLLYPGVKLLTRLKLGTYRISVTMASFIVMLTSILVLGFASVAIVNLVVLQGRTLEQSLRDPTRTEQLADQLTDLIRHNQRWMRLLLSDEELAAIIPDTTPDATGSVGSPSPDATPAGPSVTSTQALEERVHYLVREELPNKLLPGLWKWANTHVSLAALLGSAGNALAILIALPIIALYMIKDAKAIRTTLMGFIPPAFVGPTSEFLDSLEATLNSYIRGQLILCLWNFGLNCLLLGTISGLSSWLLVALISGALDIVPLIGPILAISCGVLMGLVAGGPAVAVKVGLLMGFVKLFEDQVLAPRILGKELDVHPLSVIFFLLAGGVLGGLPGALLSLPVAATLKVMLQHYYPPFIQRVQLLLVDNPTPQPLIVTTVGSSTEGQ